MGGKCRQLYLNNKIIEKKKMKMPGDNDDFFLVYRSILSQRQTGTNSAGYAVTSWWMYLKVLVYLK